MKVNLAEIPEAGNTPIPQRIYRARVVSSKDKVSDNGNDMCTLTCEILSPETVEVNGKTYLAAGRQFSLFLMYVLGENWGMPAVNAFLSKLAPAVDKNAYQDTKEIGPDLEGVEFDIILDSYEEVKRFKPEPGERVGKPMLDGEGNPMSNGWFVGVTTKKGTGPTQLSDVLDKCNPVRGEVPKF